jgi:hypothetical protein
MKWGANDVVEVQSNDNHEEISRDSIGKVRKNEDKEYVPDSRTCVRLSGLPSLGGKRNMSVKVPTRALRMGQLI